MPSVLKSPKPDRKIIAVSNRAPYSFKGTPTELKLERAVGGLVSGIDPVMRERGGVWIAWGDTGAKGRKSRKIEVPVDHPRYSLKLIHLTDREVDDFYVGISNNALWPLAHSFVGRCNFRQSEWQTFVRVNQKIARAVVEEYRPGDIVWVQDYHLSLVPAMVRARRNKAKIVFFWHVPFPAREIFTIFPWRAQLLLGLLGSDVMGFHTMGYARNFLQCVRKVLGMPVYRKRGVVKAMKRTVRVQAIPMGVDVPEITRAVNSNAVREQARALRRSMHVSSLAISVDRLDYTKGILERLWAVETFLEDYPVYHGKFVLVQIVVPSRIRVEEYRRMREEIDRAVGRINGRFTRPGWTPIHYMYRALPFETLLAYYHAADIALVTPLRDGMNLVAKEYIASHVDGRGILILSEFAGAAEEMDQAIIVNPYDPQDVVQSLVRALEMPHAEQRHRMRRLRAHVIEQDLKKWADDSLNVMNN